MKHLLLSLLLSLLIPLSTSARDPKAKSATRMAPDAVNGNISFADARVKTPFVTNRESAVLSISSDNNDFQDSGFSYRIISDVEKTVCIVGGTYGLEDYVDTLSIPSEVTYNGVRYDVVSISSGAFQDRKIGTVVIPASIQNIGTGCFGGKWDDCYECDDYAWVYYPREFIVSDDNPVYSSYYGILYNKDKTSLIEVPYGLCQNVYLPKALKTVPRNAFNDRLDMYNKTLYIPDLTNFCQIDMGGRSSTSGTLFSHFGSIKYKNNGYYEDFSGTLSIPSDVTSIGRGAFFNCTQISKVIFPATGVTEIGDYAFAQTKLKNVTLPSTIQTIGRNAFYEEWVEYIGDDEDDYPIYQTWKMQMDSIVIPQNIQSIGYNAFCMSSGAFVISKSNSPKGITAGAFKNASSCKLIVPQGTRDMYAQLSGWEEFGTIEEDESLTSYMDNEIFTATINDDVEMTFMVLSSVDKTVQVGDGAQSAINNSYDGDVIIPSQINGLSVVKISRNAFSNCTNLQTVIIPDGVTTIESSAFSRATVKNSISLPNTLTNIRMQAFFYSNIGEITLPSSLTLMDSWAFDNGSIGQLNIPYSTSSILQGYISGGRYDTSLFRYVNIGIINVDREFANRNITNYQYGAFYYCSIEELHEGQNANVEYGSCTITHYFPCVSQVFSQNFSFYNSNSETANSTVKNLYIPEGVKQISKIYRSPQNLFIPSTVEIIDDNVFPSGAPSVITSSIISPPVVNNFGNYSSKLFIPAGTYDAYVAAGWTENVFLSGISEINCIWNYEKETNTLTFTGSGDIPDYSVKPWDIYSASVETVIIGNGFTTIGSSAFSGCSSLTSVTIPESMTTIGSSAFAGCSSLTSITIPETVTSIGYGAFAGCTSLTSIIIPESVTSIGNNAFSHCTSLTSITIPESVTTIGSYAFSYCTSLTNITIPEGVNSIGWAALSGCSGLTSITIPETVTSIDECAFQNCSSLTSITIPEGVTKIGFSAFSGCTGLTSITSYIKEPFELDNDTFVDISSSCVLYVPAGTRDAYIAAGWTEDIFKGGVVELEEQPIIHNTTPGDVNNDSEINGFDIVIMVDIIMGDTSVTYDMSAADLDGDGEINGFDLVELVDLILSQPVSGAKARRAPKKFDFVSNPSLLISRNSNGEISVGMESNDDFILSQFILELSEGQHLTGISASDKHHVVAYRQVDDNRYSVLCYSTKNAIFTDSRDMLTISCDRSGTVRFSNVMLIDAEKKPHYVRDTEYCETTGIVHVNESFAKPTDIYSISGAIVRKNATSFSGLGHGIYIVDGKTLIIK